MAGQLSETQLGQMQAYWDAANQLARHHDYVRQHLDDIPEIRDWVWTD
jgi:phosphoketolase